VDNQLMMTRAVGAGATAIWVAGARHVLTAALAGRPVTASRVIQWTTLAMVPTCAWVVCAAAAAPGLATVMARAYTAGMHDQRAAEAQHQQAAEEPARH
jgi:hypothetical protein